MFTETINILNNHYPERLHKCFLIDTPWLFSLIWKAITPFIPEATKQKVKFVKGSETVKREVFSEYFEMKEFDKRFGGEIEYEYSHELYWSQKLKRKSPAKLL